MKLPTVIRKTISVHAVDNYPPKKNYPRNILQKKDKQHFTTKISTIYNKKIIWNKKNNMEQKKFTTITQNKILQVIIRIVSAMKAIPKSTTTP